MNAILAIPVLLAACGAAFGEVLVFEAEHATNIKLNYEIKELPGASGGLALSSPEGAGGTFGYGSNTNPDVFIGSARFDFEIETEGDYFVSARVWWMDKCGNRFDASLDGGRAFYVGCDDHASHLFRKWYWQKAGPFRLTKGKHYLIETVGEDGPAVDRWCIHTPEFVPNDDMAERWPGKFADDPLEPISVSVAKPTELIDEDGKRSLTIWARKCKAGPVEGTIAVKGPDDMAVKPEAKFPVKFAADETLKRFDVVLEFPKTTPRSEKKVRVLALDEKDVVRATAMCILARPWDWHILGALPAPTRVEDALGLGNKVDLKREVTYQDGDREQKIAWKPVPRTGFNPFQTIDFEKIYGQSVSVTAYLYAEISVPQDKSYLMLVNNDGALNLWIDGNEVFTDPTHHPSEGWLRHREIALPKGRHKVLARVEQNDTPDNDFQQNYWLFRLRLREQRTLPSQIEGAECAGK